MAKSVPIDIQDLALDLRNYRTVEQPKEIQAVQAMISVSPDRFWALTESLLDDGYLPTENVIVSKDTKNTGSLTVREGNRRVAALKLIHGLLPKGGVQIPAEIATRIKSVPDDWKDANRAVPCVVYGTKEASTVDRIVTLIHGKGEKAAREGWMAIARARHNRDANGGTEPGLDLLEKYFKSARNVSREQADNWSGTYPITLLDEVIKKLAPRLRLANAPELARKYPRVDHRAALDAIVKAIGEEAIDFKKVRDIASDFAAPYGVPPHADPATSQPSPSSAPVSNPNVVPAGNLPPAGGQRQAANTAAAGSKATAAAGAGTKNPVSVATNDPKAVMRTLRKFSPRGAGREKVVTLKNEMLSLKLEKAPMAFCFLLRSAFEISAKAYCDDHAANGGPACTDGAGNDRKLVEVLRDIVAHLTRNKADRERVKQLHGAMTELGKTEGVLSVTSMNQLVHNRKFSVLPGDVAVVFGNVFPLLDAMNS